MTLRILLLSCGLLVDGSGCTPQAGGVAVSNGRGSRSATSRPMPRRPPSMPGADDRARFHLTGRTLAEVARARGSSPIDTMMDLVVEDGSRVGTAYTVTSEDNVRLGLAQPWISLGSDEEAPAPAPECLFLQSNPHPRAYGNSARFLGRYVRDGRQPR